MVVGKKNPTSRAVGIVSLSWLIGISPSRENK